VVQVRLKLSVIVADSTSLGVMDSFAPPREPVELILE
jgi:hypothetical protein